MKSPFELILFGGTGDLSLRKLLPALYFLFDDKRLSDGKIIALGRHDYSDADFRKLAKSAVKNSTDDQQFSETQWKRFQEQIFYLKLDITQPSDFKILAEQCEMECENRLYYFATASSLYGKIASSLSKTHLINNHSKVILEKPIGFDYESAKLVNESIKEFFTEDQIYRIDHYLGKETVQNLMVLRFANSLFENQWNQKYIDHIQITISETLGVEKRAEFYESVGAFRDMLQNHLLQLLCITAMEPPAHMHPDAVRDEKIKVIRALKPIRDNDVNKKVVRGQYQSGVSDGEAVIAYQKEEGVSDLSHTETFVAIKAEINNWRWAGVPFYLRTGKRLTERSCEIVVQFKEIPHSIFDLQHKKTMANKLVFRLQPDEGIRLLLCEKKVGAGMQVTPMTLSLNPEAEASNPSKRVPEAYERLIHDALCGNATLFVRDDELLEAWRWADPILKYWQEHDVEPENYTAGTWGPAAATLLLAKDGRLWNDQTSS